MKSRCTEHAYRKAVLPVAVGMALAMIGQANAVQLTEEGADLSIRWDNSVRYNAGWRMQNPKSDLAAPTSNIFATEQKFQKNDMVTNRVNLLSELDLVYKGQSGLRVSASAWYDKVYDDHTMPQNPYFIGGQYPGEISRYYNGPSGEFLDAFAFTKFTLGEVPVNLKLGQHTVLWGETLFSLADGVSAGQSYVDLRKAIATPGAEAKELFKPLPQLSFSAQVSSELAVMGQYFFDFRPDLVPLGGTYFAPVDFLTYTGTTVVNPLVNWQGVQYNGMKKRGDWGVGAKWSPQWLDGTAGLYYREYTPKNSGALAVNSAGSGLAGGSGPAVGGMWFDPAAPRTKLLGLSLGKTIGGVSIGTDLTYRKDATLQTKAFTIIGGPSYPLSAPATGSANGVSGWAPVGDIVTGTVNMVAYDGKRALYDSAILMAEFAFDYLRKVTANSQNFGGEANCVVGTSDLNPGAPNQGYFGCATKSSYGISLLFQPTWFGVFPGTDLSMPIFFGRGLHGNSSVPILGQNNYMGSYSIGVTADVNRKYNLALKFNGQLYKRNINSATGVPFSNAALGDFSDRNWLSFTAKVAF